MTRVSEDDLDSEPYGPALHQGVRFTGEAEERLPDGTLISLTSYVDGLQDGLEQEWYSNGALRSEGNFRQGMAVGVHHTWDPDGNLVRQMEFSDDGRVLRRCGFDSAGNVTWEDAG